MNRFRMVVPILLALAAQASGEPNDRRHIPISMADIARFQAEGAVGDAEDINERLRAMAGATRFSRDYLLGPGDVVEVSVFGIDALEKKQLALDSEGEISLPFLEHVRLLGLTARESEAKIAQLYASTVMKNPQVSVSVREYRSQFVNVLGAVVKPGTYQITRKIFLVDALAMAGGLLAEKAEPKVYVHRAAAAPLEAAGPEAAGAAGIEIDLARLLEQGDVGLNVPIYAGDVVSVPERIERFYYVLGDVHRGGAFEIKAGERITLSQALASAGGTMTTAKAGRTAVMRHQEDGTTRQIPVDVKKVLKGEAEDIALAPNDVVFVPGSTTRTICKGILSSIGNVVHALVYVGLQ